MGKRYTDIKTSNLLINCWRVGTLSLPNIKKTGNEVWDKRSSLCIAQDFNEATTSFLLFKSLITQDYIQPLEKSATATGWSQTIFTNGSHLSLHNIQIIFPAF
jgi:hypothetical protein